MSALKLILYWVLLIPILIIGYPVFILIFIGLVPTILALIMERSPLKASAFCIGTFSLCGIVPFVVELWPQRQSLSFLFQLLRDPNTWLVLYGTAGIGYSLFIGIPPIVEGAVRISLQRRIRGLKKQQAILVKEWSEELTKKTH